MKFLILCRAPHLYSCQRLKEVAEARGHNIDILDPNRCILKLEENPPHFQIYYQDNWGDKPRLLSDYDGVIPRFGPTSTQMGCAVLTHYQGKGVYCLNDAQSFLLARDKWQSLQHLMQNEIPIPTSLFWGEEVQIGEMREQLSMPTILKTLSGSQGVGVMLAERRQSAVSILETFKQHRIPVLAQNFIEEAGNADIRCFVIGHQVVAIMQRKGQEGEFRANCHRGGKAEEIILNEEEKNIAIRAAQTMGLVVAGVDLIRSNHGLLVLEVNASPGLEMIEKTTQIDLALQMILYLETQIETR